MNSLLPDEANLSHKSTILIVDDDPTARTMMKSLLAGEGYELAFAEDGPQALAMARELTPDLILLDVMMPDMDGFEVCRRLRAEPLTAEMPIIMITALTNRQNRLQGVEAGADDFISKPFDPAEMRGRIRTITRLNRYHLLRERAKFEHLYYAVRQVDRLQVLNDLDRALSTTLDQKEVVEITLHRIAAALGMPLGALISFGEDRVEQIFTLQHGWIEPAACENVPSGSLEAMLRAMRARGEKTPLANPDLTGLSQYVEGEWGPHSLLVPVADEADGHIYAALALGGRLDDHPLTDDDLALVQAAAARAAQAIRNARLYRASQEQSARLATLNTISAAAVSSLDLDTVLRQILELTTRALDAETASVLIGEPDTGGMVFVLSLTDALASLHSYHLAPGEGFAGWAAQHGQSVCVNDVRSDPRWHSGVDEAIGFQTRSLICAPLIHHDKITGVIEVINKRQGVFTAEDLSLLESVASIAAAALENTRLYMAIKAQAAELSLLNEISLTVASTLDFDMIAQAALFQVQRRFQADHVGLLQPDPQTGEILITRALLNRKPAELPLRFPPGEGLVGKVLQQRQAMLIEDVSSDPTEIARALDSLCRHLNIEVRSIMAAPLIAKDRPIGVIEVASKEAGIYLHDDLHALQGIASILSVALQNAGLYGELKTLLHELEKAQAHLIHAEKMTALGRLAASIAHEINNPLQAVQTYLTLAQEESEGISESLRQPLARYLGTVGDEIERISAIVRRMRDFYRPAREGLQPTYLHAVLESVLELTRKQLQQSNIAVERAWAVYLPEIQANPDHLKQVFLNLVLNAIDAMPAGGTLHISTGVDQIEIGNDRDGRGKQEAVRVELSDTGEGMSPEVLARLFEPFFTTKERGTGLGLSISYGIIQAHHGQISVESHVGLGTTYSILLPVEQPQIV